MGRPSPSFPQPSGSPRQAVLICLGLIAVVFFIYGQTLWFDFVNYDDSAYTYDNPTVLKGLTWEGFKWAFMYGEIGHWHPLTWLSHMLDAQLYGLNAGGHHLTNVLLHAASAVLLFLSLRKMTGTVWRSAFVAALFAVHPLRVESVAWIAERKDVLAGFFFMLILWAYAGYVRQPSRRRYWLVALFLALGLLSKNMLVTVPCVLLLLDVWPLRRIGFPLRWEEIKGFVWEKLPLFALSAASCVATFLAPEPMSSAIRLSFPERFGNAVVSCTTYLGQTVWPAGLMIPYLGTHHAGWRILLSFAILAAFLVWVWMLRKRCPYLLVGWLWYLGMLAPVIGIVQISYYAQADRYTYLPHVGICLMIAWGVADWTGRVPRAVLGGVAGLLLASLMICSWIQTAYWKNSEALWQRSLACDPANSYAYYGMGEALGSANRPDEALEYYRKSLAMNPDYGLAHNNLGILLKKQGKMDEAAWQFQETIRLEPDFTGGYASMADLLLAMGNFSEAETHARHALRLYPEYVTAHNTLGAALSGLGRPEEAVGEYREALRLDPDSAMTHANLGNELLFQGKTEEAIEHARRAYALKPQDPAAAYNLANALAVAGQNSEAVGLYREAIRLQPDLASAHGNLAILLATQGMTEEALEHYRLALESQPGNATIHNNLAVALAAQGKVDEAIAHYQEAIRLNPGYLQPCLNLGNLLASQKKMVEARKWYEQALKIDPANVQAREALAALSSKKR